MESSIKLKNILILLSVALSGVAVGIVSTVGSKEDIQAILGSIRKEESVEVSIVEEGTQEKKEDIPDVVEEETVDPCPIRIDISGAVKNPGVYCLEKDSAFVDAVKKAGGFTNGIAQKYISMKVNLAQILSDNSKIYIPYEEDSKCELLEFKLPKEIVAITEPQPQPSTEPSETTSECISINSASAGELDSLEGVGPSTAQKIIDGRPYAKIEDILNVSGIGQSTYDKFKSQICL
mgnify:CR=1 FL=1